MADEELTLFGKILSLLIILIVLGAVCGLLYRCAYYPLFRRHASLEETFLSKLDLLSRRLDENKIESLSIIAPSGYEEARKSLERGLVELGDNKYTVLVNDTEVIKSMLNRLEMEMSGLYDSGKIAQLGEFIGAQAIVMCEHFRLDSSMLTMEDFTVISIKVIVTESGKIIFSDTVTPYYRE